MFRRVIPRPQFRAEFAARRRARLQEIVAELQKRNFRITSIQKEILDWYLYFYPTSVINGVSKLVELIDEGFLVVVDGRLSLPDGITIDQLADAYVSAISIKMDV